MKQAWWHTHPSSGDHDSLSTARNGRGVSVGVPSESRLWRANYIKGLRAVSIPFRSTINYSICVQSPVLVILIEVDGADGVVSGKRVR